MLFAAQPRVPATATVPAGCHHANVHVAKGA